MLSILAPARTALWIAIGCQRVSHFANADMVASSANSSYAVRSLIDQAVRSAQSSASSKAPRSSAALNVMGRSGASGRL